ncbi:MAG: nitroreductase family protein [Myxococcales bacterium]|nr:nitroreductase family protein [Myxococcales bacterium]
MARRADDFRAEMARRRSVRMLSDEPVPIEVIESAIATASTAPSGAHHQPWRFVVTGDPSIKREIRLAAEAEERETYARRMSDEWREALRPLGTDASKPYLELVPWIVVAFEQRHGVDDDGGKIKHFYVKESVGLACGLFIAAVHTMGLVTLTHTPSPMGFLTKILGRPEHERPFILFPVGYPAADARVPDLQRKSLDEVSAWDPPRGDAARDR